METVQTDTKIHYKYCIVPTCKNTTVTAPDKHYFTVPKDKKIRAKWCKVMKREKSLSEKSVRYCCEDHFNVAEDTENFMRHRFVGGRLFLKKNVLPHKFGCQRANLDIQERQLNNLLKNEEKTKLFFQLVKESDQLWNVNSPLFNDEDIAVWTRLLTALHVEHKQKGPEELERLATRLKNQWQIILDQYQEALIKETPYKYEEHLEFVKEIVKNRAEKPVEIKIKIEPKENIEIEIENDNIGSDVEQEETDALASTSEPVKKKIKIEYDEDGSSGEEINEEGEHEEEEEGEDEDLAFFASVTGRVKSLPEEGKVEFRKEVMKLLRRLKKKYETTDKHKGKQYRQVGKTVKIE